MTIQELITKLKNFPMDSEVWYLDNEWGCYAEPTYVLKVSGYKRPDGIVYDHDLQHNPGKIVFGFLLTDSEVL